MRNPKIIKKASGAKKLVLWFILAGVMVVQVFFAIETATLGANLASLEEKERELAKKNQELSDELVKTTSLSAIGGMAEKLGFFKPQKAIYITGEETVAKAP